MSKIRRSILALCALLGLALAAAPPAGAVRIVSQEQTWTAANGPVCGGFTTVTATSAAVLHHENGTRVDNRGRLRFWVQGSFLGISGTPYPCDLRVTVHWRNLQNGRAGAFSGQVAGALSVAPSPGRGLSRTVTTGSGTVVFRVVPALPHLGAPPARIVVY